MGKVVVIWAAPEVTVTGLPSGVEPSLNCTVPAAPGGVSVAVRVSTVPVTLGDVG